MHGRLDLEEVLDYISNAIYSMLSAWSNFIQSEPGAYHQPNLLALEPYGMQKEQEASCITPEID